MSGDVICEAFIRGACQNKDMCSALHTPLPYQWQITLPGQDSWDNLQENVLIEEAFSNPKFNCCNIKLGGARALDGTDIQVEASINFMTYEVLLCPHGAPQCKACVRRLSTVSFAKQYGVELGNTALVDKTSRVLYPTQWIWYWLNNDQWKAFDECEHLPSSSVLEAKHQQHQLAYRFDVKSSQKDGSSKTELTMLLNFTAMMMTCLEDGSMCTVQRRPLFLSPQRIEQGQFLLSPKNMLLQDTLPEHWVPMSSKAEYELVPLHPESTAYHLVAGEMLSSLSNAKIHDIFHLQNPFLYQKYEMKKKSLLSRRDSVCEKQLFHGTKDESVVRAIFTQNFDWRMHGRNATCYGKGAYFAIKSKLSHRYTGDHVNGKLKRMFLARVLVGRYTTGKAEYTRPPPVDKTRPYGELYDSCVDSIPPQMFVVFDTDQYYPEYVISYDVTSD